MWQRVENILSKVICGAALLIAVIAILIFCFRLTNTQISDFWNVVSAMVSAVIGYYTYQLNKKLTDLQENQMEEDSMPIVMLESVNIIDTKCSYDQAGRFICNNIADDDIVFTQIAMEHETYNQALQINLINMSNNYLGLILDSFEAKRDDVVYKFNTSTSRIKEQMVYLSNGASEKLYLVFNNLTPDMRGFSCELLLHLCNRVGKQYNQKILFTIVSTNQENVLTLRKKIQKPEKVN